MMWSRILGIAIVLSSLFAYVNSSKYQESARTNESSAHSALEGRAATFFERAAEDRASSKRWGAASGVLLVAGVAFLVGSTYLARRKERERIDAVDASTGLSSPRLTGLPRRGAILALAGAILGLIALDMPGRSGVAKDGGSVRIPVQRCSYGAATMVVVGLAAAILAGVLILSRAAKWRPLMAGILTALAGVLAANSVYVFFFSIPSYYNDATFGIGYGAFVNLLAAVAVLAGAILCLLNRPTPNLQHA